MEARCKCLFVLLKTLELLAVLDSGGLHGNKMAACGQELQRVRQDHEGLQRDKRGITEDSRDKRYSRVREDKRGL